MPHALAHFSQLGEYSLPGTFFSKRFDAENSCFGRRSLSSTGFRRRTLHFLSVVGARHLLELDGVWLAGNSVDWAWGKCGWALLQARRAKTFGDALSSTCRLVGSGPAGLLGATDVRWLMLFLFVRRIG